MPVAVSLSNAPPTATRSSVMSRQRSPAQQATSRQPPADQGAARAAHGCDGPPGARPWQQCRSLSISQSLERGGSPMSRAHFHWAKSGEYVTQVTAIGPLGLDYLDPGDDPRNA